MEGLGRARRQRGAAGLDGAAHVVDEQRARAHQRVAGAHHGEVVLALFAAVADRGEQLGVEAPQPRQPLGVMPVGLALAAGNQRDLARVGDNHLVAELRHDTGRRPPRPLLQQRVEARLHPFEDRLPPRFALDPHRLGQPQVAPHGVAADPHLPGRLPPAQTFDQIRGRHPMFVTGKGRAVVTLVTGPRQAASSVSPSPEMLGHAPKWITIRALIVSTVSDSVRGFHESRLIRKADVAASLCHRTCGASRLRLWSSSVPMRGVPS